MKKWNPTASGNVVSCIAATIAILGYYYHDRFFKWLDERIQLYWAMGGLCFALVIGSALLSDESRFRWLAVLKSRAAFALLLALTLVAFRWPSVVANRQFGDPDESQLLAGAITLTHDPIFFRSVDGTTHGPLDQYVFTIPHLFGLPIDYLTGRCVLLLINWLALVAAWLALGTFVPERFARISVLPALAFFAWATVDAMVQCGTEDLPSTLIMVALAFACFGWQRMERGQSAMATWFASGACLGAVPFAKLQGVLPAAACGAAIFAAVAFTQERGRRKAGSLAALLLGAVTPAAILGEVFVSSGIFPDFWQAYIANNLSYAQQKHHSLGWMLLNFFSYTRGTGGYFFFVSNAALIALGSLLLFKAPRPWVKPIALLATCVVFTLLAVIMPGRAYEHYLRLLVVPLAVLAGAMTAVLFAVLLGGSSPAKNRFALVALIAVILLPLLGERFRPNHAFRYGGYHTERKLRVSPVAQVVRRYAGADDSLAMWGWEPRIYVETQLRQATREAHSVRQLEPSLQQPYYRDRFVRDILASRPVVFVDAVGEGNFILQDRVQLGHETLPELGQLISRDYLLVHDIDGFRVYVRKDRAAKGPQSGHPIPQRSPEV